MFCCMVSLLRAEEAEPTFVWDPPKVVASVFTQDLGMLDSERDEYATNLAVYASNSLLAAKASDNSLLMARRVLALALQLSARNKRAVVVNFQLSKGMLPELIESNYSPQVLARLLLTRGQLLEKQGGGENKRLAAISSNSPPSWIRKTRTPSTPARCNGWITGRWTGRC